MTAPRTPPGTPESAPTPRETARVLRTLQHAAEQVQDYIARTLGVSASGRAKTVGAMLENNARRVPAYWIQLFLSMGIATLGLVLGSTAVVIGAMLVSPLMGPIIELGMGFAVGSSLLVLRAALRVLVSIVVVVLGATLITLLVPFHEVTAEVASRTAPTALDLLVAIFCALAAVYTTVRPGADTTAAAAGTAIGIALVPPLCVVGFGLGTGSGTIAGGASLLFVANLSGILVFAVFCFFLLGYNRVDAPVLEHEYLEHPDSRTERIAQRAHQRLAVLLGSRYGLATRLLVPVLFFALVYVPLRRALDEVSWQVRVRDEIRRILAREASRAVQSSLSVERHAVTLRLWMVGTRDSAVALERRLATRIAAAAGVTPSIAVSAVPDANALAAATGTRDRRGMASLQSPEFASRLGPALQAVWPAEAVGPLTGWRIELDHHGGLSLVVQHPGFALGTAAEALLSRQVSTEVGLPLRIVDKPLPTAPLVAARGREAVWLAEALRIVAEAQRGDSIVTCILGPRAGASNQELLAALRTAAGSSDDRVVIQPGRAWSVRVASRTCASPPARRRAAGGATPTP